MKGMQFQFDLAKKSQPITDQLVAMVGRFSSRFAMPPLRILVHPDAAHELPDRVNGVPVVATNSGLPYASSVFLVKEAGDV